MKPTTLVKKLPVVLVVIILLILDWAALHDIIKGETNQTLEYITMAFSLVVFVMLFFFWLKSRKRTAQVM
jgi:hypothetical protein